MCMQSPRGYTFTCMCVHVESRGKPQCLFPGLHLFTLVFGQSLSLPPGSPWLGWLAGQWAPGITQLPPPQCWGHKHMLPHLVFWSLGSASHFLPALPRLSSLKPPLPTYPLFSCFPQCLCFPPVSPISGSELDDSIRGSLNPGPCSGPWLVYWPVNIFLQGWQLSIPPVTFWVSFSLAPPGNCLFCLAPIEAPWPCDPRHRGLSLFPSYTRLSWSGSQSLGS